jgi:NodT family efflux transporter outer membrane factor (OMF) lipoprotein
MRRFSLLLLASACMLAGCAVGPDFVRPEAPKSTRYTKEPLMLQAAPGTPDSIQQHLVENQDIPAQWWELFHSKALNALVEEALKNNPDLKSARAALKQAQENVSAQQAAFFPTIQAQFEPSRQKNSAIVAPTLASNQTLFNLYTPQVSASWTPDIFGGNRRQVEALKAHAEYQRFEFEAAYLTLTSNLVAAAINEASLRAQITATQDIIHIEKEQLDIIQKQFKYNIVPEASVIAQQTTLAQAQATLPPLQKQLAQERDLITALLGKLPDAEPKETFALDALDLPHAVPLTLPSKLVEQRPDIRAAEAQLHEASAEVGVAIANLLPNITLSATDGSTATQFAKLFSGGTGFFGIFGNVTQTVFDGGSLLHKKRASDAALDEAANEYQSTVVTAFRNVADSLRALQYDVDAVNTTLEAEQLAQKSLDIARKQVELGSTGYITLLNAQQAYQQTFITLMQARAMQYTDTAVLFQALGGGWWNRKAH